MLKGILQEPWFANNVAVSLELGWIGMAGVMVHSVLTAYASILKRDPVTSSARECGSGSTRRCMPLPFHTLTHMLKGMVLDPQFQPNAAAVDPLSERPALGLYPCLCQQHPLKVAVRGQ